MYSDKIDEVIRQEEAWAHRRELGVSSDKRVFVLTCMDERVPIERALNLVPGDAHVFRNAGGLVTDDVIRSVALSIHVFGTQEIIIVNHTDCGMFTGSGQQVNQKIEQAVGVSLDQIPLDPDLAEFRLGAEGVSRWWKMQTDLDKTTRRQLRALRDHPLIPKGVSIKGYIYNVRHGQLRLPVQETSVH